MNKLSGELFFNRCDKKFNNKFTYHNDYNGMDKQITVTCPIHGDFQTLSEHHWQSKDGGCLSCQKDKHMLKYVNNGDIFITKSKLKHNNKYDYSLVNYVNAYTKVKIGCPIHGIFEQTPGHHLNHKQGCAKCATESNAKLLAAKAKSDFVSKARSIHGDKYTYELVDYVNSQNKVKIVCPIHGVLS